ncbi:DUF3147 family protein [Turneriella parva]|uniref:DUF3147 family protein n=1 Tax=Turneriella parva (strain ATCC BAA-1111 / DSM 21527 / NCTC 11395 / H) TaxID=869212 RepID=I4B9X3_TURPD|nr:DUF3147 family protein [Turneriella parva]AFM14080.1 hypothetical protein Turpa_3443 [Turneriella parva DSM 21527]
MSFILFKYAVTAGFIVLASEIAKRSDKFGALILALPLMTILTLFWLSAENQSEEKIANHAYYTFWYVIPTLPLFLLFPILLRSFGFSLAMVLFTIGTVLSFVICSMIFRKFGIDLY